MFTLPVIILSCIAFKRNTKLLIAAVTVELTIHCLIFLYLLYYPVQDPVFDRGLNEKRQEALMSSHSSIRSFADDLASMSPYAKLNALLKYEQHLRQQIKYQRYSTYFPENKMPTLWQEEHNNEELEMARFKQNSLNTVPKLQKEALASMEYFRERRAWLNSESLKLHHEIMPLIRPFHFEDDAGGSPSLNNLLPFFELTRINRKDLFAALIFGIRISLVVGVLSVALGLIIGLPIGAFAGYYGGSFDIIVSRMLEIWEAMPTFFMLLMIVAITQSKSIFLIIGVIGMFGWTGFSRYLRGEFFKQRNLPYVEACKAQGFSDYRIIFSHIFPNAISPVLTLLPFVIMGAITSEAGLSFLGLGEEGSSSLGGLMDEGRLAFPGESYLLWPPAILLTTLLVAIAIMGDQLRDALDPKS